MGDFVKLKTNPFPAKYPVAPLVGPDGQRIDPRTVARAQDLERLKEAAIDLRDHTAGYVNVKSYRAVGDDVADDTDAIFDAHAAAVSSGEELVFPAGIYRYTASPNFAANNLRVRGKGKVVLHFVGSGVAFNIDAGTDGVFGLAFKNLEIRGNALATDGLFLRGVHRSIFDSITVRDVTAAALHVRFSVGNRYDTFAVSKNDGAFAVRPATGIFIEDRAIDGEVSTSTAQTFVNPTIQGVSGSAVKLDKAQRVHLIGGSLESGGRGLEFSPYASWNVVSGTWLEDNSVEDALIQGGGNAIDVRSTGLIHVSGLYALNNRLYGQLHSVTVDSGAATNVLAASTMDGTFTDNGTTIVAPGVSTTGAAFAPFAVPRVTGVGGPLRLVSRAEDERIYEAYDAAGVIQAFMDASGGSTQNGGASFGWGISPGQPSVGAQGNRFFMCSSVPSNVHGNDGDFCFRTDTPGVVNQRVYMKASGAWAGIL